MINHKFCTKCENSKSIEDFNKNSQKKDGLQAHCRKCARKYAKEWFYDNHERALQTSINWKWNNIDQHRSNTQKNRAENAERYKIYRTEYERKRYDDDTSFQLTKKLRNRLRNALKKGYKSGSAVQDLGCSIEEFKLYIEGKFKPGMSWCNWSKDGWHLDHKIPLSQFDLTNRKQLLAACHYTNLQPLWAIDNLKKWKKVP